MKDDILIINGKKYIHTPEVKEERLSGWIKGDCLRRDLSPRITLEKMHNFDDTRMIEIRDSEIIVSEC